MGKSHDEKPKLFSLGELAAQDESSSQPALLLIKQDEWERTTKGIKPEPGRAIQSRGLLVIPIPGFGGFAGFPVCGPNERPHFGPNGWQCLPSDFNDDPDPRDPVDTTEPPCGGQFVIEAGRISCSGGCRGGYRCAPALNQLDFGFWFLRCECVPLSLRERLSEADDK